MSSQVSTPDALIYAMVTVSAVDRIISEGELRKIEAAINQLPVFADFDAGQVATIADACGKLLGEQDGLQRVLDLIAENLPQKLYETAYALAVDVAAVDVDISTEEVRFLDMLRSRLSLDKLTIAGIERGACARHRT